MIDQIRPSQLAGWLQQQDRPAVVLDVREPEELRTASVRADGFELRAIPMNEVPARIARDRADVVDPVERHALERYSGVKRGLRLVARIVVAPRAARCEPVRS